MLVDLATAKLHLRVTDGSEDVGITAMLATAEEQAQAFLNRGVYDTPEALAAAIAAAPAALSAASVAYDAALTAASALETCVERLLNEQLAKDVYNAAIEAWILAMRGMVVNDSIITAILLIVASLWEHRGDEDAVAGIPQAAERLLWPSRIGVGV